MTTYKIGTETNPFEHVRLIRTAKLYHTRFKTTINLTTNKIERDMWYLFIYISFRIKLKITYLKNINSLRPFPSQNVSYPVVSNKNKKNVSYLAEKQELTDAVLNA